MVKNLTLDLNSPEYEAACWDTAIYVIKQEEAKRHQKLIDASTKVRDAMKEFLDGDKD